MVNIQMPTLKEFSSICPHCHNQNIHDIPIRNDEDVKVDSQPGKTGAGTKSRRKDASRAISKSMGELLSAVQKVENKRERMVQCAYCRKSYKVEIPEVYAGQMKSSKGKRLGNFSDLVIHRRTSNSPKRPGRDKVIVIHRAREDKNPK